MRYLVLAGFVVGCEVVGALGALFVTPALDGWYRRLDKPAWTPPNWIFAPVWTTLYLLMGLAAFLAWENGTFLGLGLFALQLVLNWAWSALFFGLRAPALALAEIALLWLTIVACTVAFWNVSRIAGALMLPYLAWTSFASTLNASVWRRNRQNPA